MDTIVAAVMPAPHAPIELREFPRPDLPPGGALLDTLYSEVCGTDVHLWHGRLSGVPYPIMLVVGVSVLGIALLLTWKGTYPSFFTSLRHSAFNVISMATTSGFVSQDFEQWPVFAPIWMLFLSSILCSTGSTGGGIKMFRTLLLARQAGRELKLLVHPSAVVPVNRRRPTARVPCRQQLVQWS